MNLLQEKKHIKEEDRLKKDMMTKLESVASEFRKAANAQMSATTQRSSSSHVFTIPESTIFFSGNLLCFCFSIEIKNTDITV